MVCLFCLKETNDGVPLHGVSELAKYARNIIAKHFWFDANEIDSAERYACSTCWSEVESFRDFYEMVEVNYQTGQNDIDTKDLVNPKLNCQLGEIEDESEVKAENGETTACTPENESVFVQSLSVLDDLHEETDRHKDKMNSIYQEQLSPTNQEPASIQRSYEATKETQLTREREQSALSNQTEFTSPETLANATGFECFVCRKPFALFWTVRRHMIHLHSPISSCIFECDLCGKSYPQKSTLILHMAYHRAKNRYDKSLDKSRMRTKCPICQKELTCKSLKTHISMVHENKRPIREKTHMCEWCGKKFDAPSMLATHALTHIDRAITQIKCEICGKFSKNQKSYRGHIKIHNRNPLKCPHCDKLAFSAFELKSHISQYHAMHKHQCTVCDKSFARPIRLKEHMATHSNESVYSCLYCAKTFKGNSGRYTHLKRQHKKEWDLYHDTRKPK